MSALQRATTSVRAALPLPHARRPLRQRSAEVRAALVACACCVGLAQAQVIAPGFMPTFNDDVHVVAAWPGERVLVGGDFWIVNGEQRSSLVRLLPDGNFDPGFDAQVAGSVLTLAVQLDGRIVIGGNFDQVNGTARVNLARLHPDGSLDTSFVPAAPDDDIAQLALQSDGKVLVAGRFDTIGGAARSYFARLQAGGALDGGFADAQLDGAVHAIAVQQDGSILIGGDFGTVHGEPRSGIARLGANGNLDGSFADPMVTGLIDALTLLDDGRVLFTGAFGTVHGETRPFIARLHANGELDGSFGDANLRGNVTLRHMQPLVDGTTMLAGEWRWGTGEGGVRVGRILANGHQDMTYEPVLFDSLVYGLTLQAGGRIYAGGLFANANGLPRSHLLAIDPTDAVVDALERDGANVTWRRTGIAPMLSAPPQLQVSEDGETWSVHATMTPVPDGWSASGVPESAGHVRARGLLTANAGLVEASLKPNLVFAYGFE